MKAVLVIDMPNRYGDIADNKAVVTLRNGKLGTSLGIYNVPLKPMPEKYIEREIKIETERDAEICTHGITLGRNLLIEELEK